LKHEACGAPTFRYGSSPRALALLGLSFLASCGGGPTTPGGPSSPMPGGTVAGRYLLEIQPGASCATVPGSNVPRGPYSFPMVASAGGTSPHPGIQVVIEGDPSSLELEFKYTDFTLRGGLGTTGEGVLTNQGQRFWINAIGTGAVTQKADGIGQVTAGTLMGYIAVAGATASQNEATACSTTDHTFTLKVR
jgi:hypothetical protein